LKIHYCIYKEYKTTHALDAQKVTMVNNVLKVSEIYNNYGSFKKDIPFTLVCQYCHTESNNLKEDVHRLPELVCSLFCYPVYLTPFHCLKL